MANIVDALVVTLGLDASQFVKNQKEAVGAFKKTGEEARKSGQNIESSAKNAAEALENVGRKALGLFAIFAGARSVKDFTEQLVSADSALGRLAANLGTTPGSLSAMANAVERNGGSASAAAGSFRALSDSFEELKNTGNTGILVMLQRLQGQGGAAIDTMHGFDKALPGIVANLTALKNRGDAVGANWFGRQLGIDEETVNFLEQGWPKVQAELKKSRELGVVSPASVKATQELTESWNSLQQAATNLGRSVLVDLEPALKAFLDAITKLIQTNPELVEAIAALLALLAGSTAVKAIASVLRLGSSLTLMGAEGVAALTPLLSLITALGIALGAVEISDTLKTYFDKAFNAVTPGATTPDIAANQSMGPIARMKKIWAERPSWLGGGGGSGGGGAGSAPAIGPESGTPGTYRPRYNLTAGDLSDSVINKIAGEARNTKESTDAVINNMLNRVGTKTYGPSGDIRQVAYAPGQYTGYRVAGAKQAEYIRSRMRAIAAGQVPDNTAGSNEYRASSYYGPWYRNHANAPVVGGNRFAYNPAGGRGGYAAYDKPHSDAPASGGFHIPMPTMPGYHAAVAAVKEAAKPVPSQVHEGLIGLRAAAARNHAASISNDNRSNQINTGPINIHPPNGDPSTIAKSIKPEIERHAFATHANSGPN